MADNVTANPASGGPSFAAREVTYSGDANVKAPVTGLVEFAGSDDAKTVSDVPIGTMVGAVAETAPASDTASSGLNGRLQRVAQRLTSLIGLLPTALGANGGLKVEGVASGTAVPVSASALPLPSGAATSAKQDTVIGHLDGVEGLLGTIATASSALVSSGTAWTPEQVTIAAASSTPLTTADAGRRLFTIHNPTAAVAYCRYAAAAASPTAFDIIVPAGSIYSSTAYEWAGEIRVYNTPGGTFNFSQLI